MANDGDTISGKTTPSNHADDVRASTDAPNSSDYISIEGLTKTFNNGGVVAVDNVDLDIRSDEFVVLLGPSGCGKTTTLRCIAGLETPDSGRILIDGEDVTRKKPKDRDLAFVFQSIALFPHMSVRDNISFGLDMSTDMDEQEKNERVADVADVLGIEEMLDRKPSALSGGQQQRVSLGRAMVMEPAAFLLDEPFSALDANLRDQMRVETKQLQRHLETAMIFVTHDQEEAMTLGDKIVIMDDARIQQIGSPYDIYNQPANLFVARFIGSPSTNFFDCRVQREGERLQIDAGYFRFTLPADMSERYDGSGEREAILGIRPEYFEMDSSDPFFEADLSVIEPHGNQDAIHFVIDGDEITVVSHQGAVESSRDSVPLSFDRRKVWLFDEEGERLL